MVNYPESHTEPNSPGQRLRRSLRQGGISRGQNGHLELRDTVVVATAQLDEATRSLWTPERIRIFISHTSAYRSDVGALARELNRFAFSCFVAHDVIEPSRQWQEVIELALRSCDIMLAYVTPDFETSKWCDQEIGWALGRELVVLPLKVGADPYGFFGTYQALPVSRKTPRGIWRSRFQGRSRLQSLVANDPVP